MNSIQYLYETETLICVLKLQTQNKDWYAWRRWMNWRDPYYYDPGTTITPLIYSKFTLVHNFYRSCYRGCKKVYFIYNHCKEEGTREDGERDGE